MSPEQIEGREVTTASDVYSLGLVLYEIFTGKRAFEGKTGAELSRAHREESPRRPSTHVSDLDPTVDEIVLQCLEKDPAARPPSALVVAAALPGGDALAQAIAAGEVPSAALLATTKSHEKVSAKFAWGAAFLLVFAFVTTPWAASDNFFLAGVPMEKPPAVLEFEAKALLKSFGYGGGADSASGYRVDGDYLVRPDEDTSGERERVRAGWPPVLHFWLRESPKTLESWALDGRVTMGNPPLLLAGMTRVLVDTTGRLVAFDAVPPSTEESAPQGTSTLPPWDLLFKAAGLDRARFEEVTPSWNPPVHSDQRAAWTGSSVEWPELQVRVEGASYRGRPVYFRLVFPWTHIERSGVSLMSRGQRIGNVIYFSLFVAILAITSFFAYRNVVAGQGDQRGGIRLAVAVMALDLGSWALLTAGSSNPVTQIVFTMRAIGSALLIGAITFTFYLALEPDVRRRSPELIMGWTRLIWGQWRDPRVGRDILIGIAAAGVATLLLWIVLPVLQALGVPKGPVTFNDPNALLGFRSALAAILTGLEAAPAMAMAGAVVLLLLERGLRTRRRAALALIVLLAVPNGLQQGTSLWAGILLSFVIMVFPVLALVRGGMLAFAAFISSIVLLVNFPLTSNYSHWTAPPTFLVGATLLAMSFLALRSVGVLGGRTER